MDLSFLKPPSNKDIEQACSNDIVNIVGLTDKQCFHFLNVYRGNTKLNLSGAKLTKDGCIQIESILESVKELELIGCEIDDIFFNSCKKLEIITFISMQIPNIFYNYMAHSNKLKIIGLYNTIYDIYLFNAILLNQSIKTLIFNNLDYIEQDYIYLKHLKVCRRELQIYILDNDIMSLFRY
jgi:hypothetical protein